ncbi:hypothetical protein [Dactylosporangium sp. CA-092794]|uniref:hypothetical protein n=1 Tax=Dactylosporangium sp. CA-092794 TaxID=3239929 RepID=UPI003D94EE8C
MNEIELLQRAYHRVPGPDDETVARARHRLDAASIAAAVPNRSRPRRLTFVAAGLGLAGITAAAIAALTPPRSPAEHTSPVITGVGTGATTRAVLTAAEYRQAMADAVQNHDYVVVQTEAEPNGVFRYWYDTATSASRLQTAARSGAIVYDMASRPASGGGTDMIEYIGKVNQYAQTRAGTSPVTKPSLPAATPQPTRPTAQDWFRTNVANGNLTVIGPTTIDGRPAIELGFTEGSSAEPGYKTGRIYVDATSYLQLRAVESFGGATHTFDYEYLPRTNENLALLWFSAQPGWQQVAWADLPRGLIS